MYVYIVGIIVSEFIIINISKKILYRCLCALKNRYFRVLVFSCVLKFNSKENIVFHNFNFYTFWKKEILLLFTYANEWVLVYSSLRGVYEYLFTLNAQISLTISQYHCYVFPGSHLKLKCIVECSKMLYEHHMMML